MSLPTEPTAAVRPITQGAVVLTCANVLHVIASYCVYLIVARSVTPTAYGAFVIVISWMTTVELLLTSGVPRAVAKCVAERPAMAGAIMRAGLIAGGAVSMCLLAAYLASSPLMTRFLHDAALLPVLLVAGGHILALTPYAILCAVANGLHRFMAQALLVSTYAVLKLVCVAALGGGGASLHGAVAGYVLAALLASVVAWLASRRLQLAEGFGMRRLVVFGTPMAVFASMLLLLINADLWMVKRAIADTRLVGYYAAAGTVAKVLYFGCVGINDALFPSVARALAAHDRTAAALHLRTICILLVTLIAPCVVVMWAAAPTIVTLLLGARYVPAAPYLRLLVVAASAATFISAFGTTFAACGRPWTASLYTGAVVISELLLITWLLPRNGAYGAAAGALIATAAGAILAAGLSARDLPGGLPLSRCMIICVIALVSFVGILGVPAKLVWLVPLCVAGAALYLALLAGVGIIDGRAVWERTSVWLRRRMSWRAAHV